MITHLKNAVSLVLKGCYHVPFIFNLSFYVTLFLGCVSTWSVQSFSSTGMFSHVSLSLINVQSAIILDACFSLAYLFITQREYNYIEHGGYLVNCCAINLQLFYAAQTSLVIS